MKKISCFLVVLFLAACASQPTQGVFPVRYDIPQGKNLSAQVCTPEQGAPTLALLQFVLQEYPPLCALGIDDIIICNDLVSFITPVAGVSILEEETTTLVLNADPSLRPRYVARTIHHEIFHAMERVHPFDAQAWDAINPYTPYLEQTPAANGVVYYTNTPALPFAPSFITQYAMTRPSEDRAELFCTIMLGEEHPDAKVAQMAQMAGDGFLRAKIFLLQAYLEHFAMDVIFSNRVDDFFSLPPIATLCLQEANPSDFSCIRTGNNDRYPLVNQENRLFYTGAYSMQSDPNGIVYCLLDASGNRLYGTKTYK